jgi:uncharacterized protein YlaI
MALTLVKVDPTNDALELRTYLCEECGRSQTYSVDARQQLNNATYYPGVVATQE